MRITVDDIRFLKKEHPAAVALVHPECRPEVIAAADGALSTGAMLKKVRESTEREFIIGTEIGILHLLTRENPDKIFYPAIGTGGLSEYEADHAGKGLWSLERMEEQITVPPDVRERAVRAVDRMLEHELRIGELERWRSGGTGNKLDVLRGCSLT